MITKETYKEILEKYLTNEEVNYCMEYINFKGSDFYKLPKEPTLADALNCGIPWNHISFEVATYINNIYLKTN